MSKQSEPAAASLFLFPVPPLLASQASRSWGTRAAWLLFAALIGLLAFYGFRLFHAAYLTAIFPGEFDYAEGIVWQQAKLIPGPRMYGDLQAYPYLVFHYPPLYHLVVHAATVLGITGLVAGRLVSTASVIALIGLAAAFVYEAAAPRLFSQQSRLGGAAIAGLLLVTFSPIQSWAYAMRVDMLAAALELLGIYLGLVSLRRPGVIYGSALAFVAAVYTKQTMIFGAAATFFALAMYARPLAWRLAAGGTIAGTIILALLTIATKGGFTRHIILYNINSFYLPALSEQLWILRAYKYDLLVALGMAAIIAMRLVSRPLRATPPGQVIALFYFTLSAINLVFLAKYGASSNYLIPWAVSWALLIGLAVAEIAEASRRQTAAPYPVILLFGLLIYQVLGTPAPKVVYAVDDKFRSEYGRLVALVGQSRKPVFSENMVLLMQAGKEVPWEPAIISELGKKGLFDERKIVARLNARQFGLVILDQKSYPGRYSAAVKAAIKNNYPDEQLLAGMRVLRPRQS